MENNLYKNAILAIPSFFATQLQVDPFGAGIFEPFKNIVDFDEAYIFFMNPDSICLKYIYAKDRRMSVNDDFPVNIDIKKDLFSPNNLIFDNKHQLIEVLGLSNFNSFLTSKLIIRKTVFGFVLLCNKKPNAYKQEEIDVSTAIGSLISYKIKDMELSEIFKVQLQALKEGLVDTKNAYKTIKQQNIKILESDELKNEFLANISHELRTPLNAIIGFSEVLSNQFYGKLNEKQSEFIRDIHISGINLLEMINEILDISKIESREISLNRTDFSIKMAIVEVINIVKPLADKKNITIEKSVTNGDVVFADFQKVRQVLYNLISNAIKFSPEKGKIEIKVNFTKSNFTIEVKDEGIGIAPKDQQRIFGKFIQLENSYTKKESSTGLGLTITKEIIEMHKGEIYVRSSIGKGATFVVNIPMITREDLVAEEKRREYERNQRTLDRERSESTASTEN